MARRTAGQPLSARRVTRCRRCGRAATNLIDPARRNRARSGIPPDSGGLSDVARNGLARSGRFGPIADQTAFPRERTGHAASPASRSRSSSAEPRWRGPRDASDGAGSPWLVLVREPDQLGVERKDPLAAFGWRLVELAVPTATSPPTMAPGARRSRRRPSARRVCGPAPGRVGARAAARARRRPARTAHAPPASPPGAAPPALRRTFPSRVRSRRSRSRRSPVSRCSCLLLGSLS